LLQKYSHNCVLHRADCLLHRTGPDAFPEFTRTGLLDSQL
jgi:hypothetical protein